MIEGLESGDYILKAKVIAEIYNISVYTFSSTEECLEELKSRILGLGSIHIGIDLAATSEEETPIDHCSSCGNCMFDGDTFEDYCGKDDPFFSCRGDGCDQYFQHPLED